MTGGLTKKAVPLPLTRGPFVAEKNILYTELLARLHFFATSHPALVGKLCQQAQSWFLVHPHPVLVPLGGFLQPPGGPLQATLTGCHKGGSPQHSKNPVRPPSFLGAADDRCFGLLSGAPFCQSRGPGCHEGCPAVSC